MIEQLDLYLHRHDTDECLREKLTDLIEEFNAEAEPMQRVILHGRISSLRRILNGGSPMTDTNPTETR